MSFKIIGPLPPNPWLSLHSLSINALATSLRLHAPTKNCTSLTRPVPIPVPIFGAPWFDGKPGGRHLGDHGRITDFARVSRGRLGAKREVLKYRLGLQIA
jgi:hypothetical protein